MNTLFAPWSGLSPAGQAENALDPALLRGLIAAVDRDGAVVGGGPTPFYPERSPLSRQSAEGQALVVASLARANAFRASLPGPSPADVDSAMKLLSSMLTAVGAASETVRQFQKIQAGVLATEVNWSGIVIRLNRDGAEALAEVLRSGMAKFLGILGVANPGIAGILLILGAVGSALSAWITEELRRGNSIRFELLLFLVPIVEAES